MENTITIYAFNKTNKAAEKRFDKWLTDGGVEGQTVKVWSIGHGHNFKGRTRYVTTVELDLNGSKLTARSPSF